MSGDSSKLHEMTKAPRRLAQSGGVREPHALRRHPSPRPQHPKRNTQGWQDSHVVHDSRGLCSEKIPFVARSSRGVFPKGDLQGISDT